MASTAADIRYVFWADVHFPYGTRDADFARRCQIATGVSMRARKALEQKELLKVNLLSGRLIKKSS